VEKYRKHRFSDGSVLVVPRDVEVNESMRHLAAAVAGAASESTPLLHKSGSRGQGLSGVSIPHPVEHVTVPHHHHTEEASLTAGGAAGAEGGEELEVGLQMQSMMRPTVGQMRGGTGVLLESHTAHHDHGHSHSGSSSGHLHSDGEAASASASRAADVESDGHGATAAAEAEEEEEDESDAALLKNVKKQLGDIWETVQLKSVWKPMAFVYVFNVLQTPNVAWQSFLQLSLHFEPYILVRNHMT
jgi:hypothetical protein